ncbi:hypothetical protein Zm00014a_020135 [Zea mays]|uniref:Uncharacterized protein n=1 Tax=Zea mays TaxID=4577 RepID=A0A3L6G597_MAIZE|nr:hypothetical protein Zm00014a_020135 [Zea mays]
MVGDLSLLAVASASPVVLPPSKGKRPQDAGVQLCAPLQQHPPHHLEAVPYHQGQPGQMVVPGTHQGQALPAAYQAITMPDTAMLIDVQGTIVPPSSHNDAVLNQSALVLLNSNIKGTRRKDDSHPDSVQLSLGIAEQCARQEKLLKFLVSGSDVKELDESLLAEFTGQQTLAINMGTHPYLPDDKLSIPEFVLNEPQHYLPEKELVIPDPLLHFIQSHGAALTIDQSGRVLLAGNGDEMRDLLSIFLAFNMSRRETGGCKAAFLVPYFERKRRSRANSQVSNLKLAGTTADVSKSTDFNSKSLSKKKHKVKNIKERDSYQRNYIHASEVILSILLDKDRSSSTILSLKKAGPEITELLTQCSIGIAGTGLAILLSVMCKMSNGMRTPFASARLLSTSVGFGLFWLSWAVNGLRDTIASIFRSRSGMNIEDDEVAVKIEKSVNEILFRALTLLAITALKFA